MLMQLVEWHYGRMWERAIDNLCPLYADNLHTQHGMDSVIPYTCSKLIEFILIILGV